MNAFNISMASTSSIGIQAEQVWEMRMNSWIYWRRGGAAAILAMPSGHSAPALTTESHLAPQPTSTKPCWSPSIYATLPRRWDGVILKRRNKEVIHYCFIKYGVSPFPAFPLQIATETGSSLEEVREEACGILEEMSQNLQLGPIRLMAYILTKVIKRLFTSIYVNMEGLNAVRTKLLINIVLRITAHCKIYTTFKDCNKCCFLYHCIPRGRY